MLLWENIVGCVGIMAGFQNTAAAAVAQCQTYSNKCNSQ